MRTDPSVRYGDDAARGAAVRTAAAIVGALLLLLGVAGFVPGATRDVGALRLVGADSGALLVGLIQVSVLLNVAHLAFGAIGLVLCRWSAPAKHFLIVGGTVSLALWVTALAASMSTSARMPMGIADNALHFGLGIGMVLAGAIAGQRIVLDPAPVDPARDLV